MLIALSLLTSPLESETLGQEQGMLSLWDPLELPFQPGHVRTQHPKAKEAARNIVCKGNSGRAEHAELQAR